MPSGGVRSHIGVTLTSASGEIVAALVLTDITDSDGNYLFEGVPLGEYTIAVSIPGQAPSAPVEVTVQTGPAKTVLTITLEAEGATIHWPILER